MGKIRQINFRGRIKKNVDKVSFYATTKKQLLGSFVLIYLDR